MKQSNEKQKSLMEIFSKKKFKLLQGIQLHIIKLHIHLALTSLVKIKFKNILKSSIYFLDMEFK